MRGLHKTLLLLMALFLCGHVLAAEDDELENQAWQELEVQLPAPPLPENLQPFEVSALTTNKFFIDLASLSVGEDGVVRYTLLIVSPEGGRTVTYEGMRCETRERRIYASGRADGSWAKSRNNQWAHLQPASVNRHHAALYLDYFCPNGGLMAGLEMIRQALKRGGYTNTWAR